MTISAGISEILRKNFLYAIPAELTVRIVDVDGDNIYVGKFTEMPDELLDLEGTFYDYDDHCDSLFDECDYVVKTNGIPKDAKIATPIISTRSCPNCGGSIKKFGNCEYCGTLIVSERYKKYAT